MRNSFLLILLQERITFEVSKTSTKIIKCR